MYPRRFLREGQIMRLRWVSLFSLLSIALAGCGSSQGKAADILNLSPSNPKEIKSHSTPLAPMPTQEDDLPEMPIDPTLPVPRSPGQQILIERARVDLAQRLSVPESQIELIESKEASWPDASLGCPQPGVDYAQIPTPGYLVKLEYGGDEFEYHIGIHGNTRYCENPTPPN